MSLFLLNKMELCIFLIMGFWLVLHHRIRWRYSWKMTLITIICLIPTIYFSVNMMTEMVTVDEVYYKEAFTNVRGIQDGPIAEKLLYSYRFTQLTMGSFFEIIPGELLNAWSDQFVWQIYKAVHYFIIILLIFITTDVWHNNILNGWERKKKILIENVILAIMIGMPVACLMIKVVNYDATSVYLGILGISMILSYAYNQVEVLGYIGTILIALGVMDKWTALPYFCIGVVLFAYFRGLSKETFLIRFLTELWTVIFSIILALLTSFISLIFEYHVQGGLYDDINIGNICYCFTQVIRVAFGGISLHPNYSERGVFSNDTTIYIVLLIVIIVVTTWCIHVIEYLIRNHFIRLMGTVLSLTVFLFQIGGAIGTYFVPLWLAPWKPLQWWEYQSKDSLNNLIFHYGASTYIGNLLHKFCFMSGMIINSIPTSITIIIVASSIVLFKNKLGNEDKPILLSYLSALMLLFFYVIGGTPLNSARYFGFSIILTSMLGCVFLVKYISINNYTKYPCIILFTLYLIEMVIYTPNIMAFSPVWVVHNDNYKKSIRVGEWHAGEIIFWGEDVAIGGNMICDYLYDKGKKEEDFSQYTIYSDYGSLWNDNPGFKINTDEIVFNDHTFFILNKVWLFRKEVPSFIYEIEPIMTISYRGEIGAWIYQGDQLLDYRKYFGVE